MKCKYLAVGYRQGSTHTNSVSTAQNPSVFSKHICCTLSDKSVFIFLNNHSYKRCSNQYTSTKYTQLQSRDKGTHVISCWVLFSKIIVSILLCGKKTADEKIPFLYRKPCENPKHGTSAELALQTPYVSYYCQRAFRKRQSKTIQPYIIPTPSFYWTSSIQRREAEHTRR